MMLPTLDEFIAGAKMADLPQRAYVQEPGFQALYLRYTHHVINRTYYKPVLDIANVVVHERQRGQGYLKRLLARLAETYPDLHLYFESVGNRDLARYLGREGFQPLDQFGLGACWFREASAIAPAS